MANLQVGNIHGVPVAAGKNINGGDDDGAGYNDADQLTIDALRSRLAAINGAYYTAAKLEQMSYNDMVYAVRVEDSHALN